MPAAAVGLHPTNRVEETVNRAYDRRVVLSLTVRELIVQNIRPSVERDSHPLPPVESPKIGAWMSLVLAGVAGFTVFAGLFMLMLQFGGPLAIVAVLVFGLGGLIALFHFVVWGWWLSGTIRKEVEAEERGRTSAAKESRSA
jgi:hypothetical protein